MGAKPSTLPRWADVGGAIVVPSSGKLDVGWVAGERPPAQYLNWYQNLVYLWVVFVGAYFTNGGAAVGASDLGTAAEATVTPTSVWRDYGQKARANVDHNGYRMGQLSEIDEHWDSDEVTVKCPLAGGLIVAGAPTLVGGSWKLTVAAQQVAIPLVVPHGCIITSVKVYHQRTTGTDSFTLDLEGGSSTGTAVSIKSTAVTTGTGTSSTEMLPSRVLLNGITAGTQIQQALQLRVTCNAVTTSDFITMVTVTYIVTPNCGWTLTSDTMGSATVGAEDTFTFADPDTIINHRSVKLNAFTTGGTGGNIFLQKTKFEGLIDTNCAYVQEFIVRTGAITDATNKRKFLAGVNLGTTNYVLLYNDFNQANWQLQVVGSGGGSTVNTDSGVAIAANTTYRVRIEIYGASLNSSGSYKCRLYINGTKVAEANSATLAASDMCRPFFQVTAVSTTGGNYDMRIGRVRRVWNHLLTSDNL